MIESYVYFSSMLAKSKSVQVLCLTGLLCYGFTIPRAACNKETKSTVLALEKKHNYTAQSLGRRASSLLYLRSRVHRAHTFELYYRDWV